MNYNIAYANGFGMKGKITIKEIVFSEDVQLIISKYKDGKWMDSAFNRKSKTGNCNGLFSLIDIIYKYLFTNVYKNIKMYIHQCKQQAFNKYF